MKPIERLNIFIKYKKLSISGFEKAVGLSNNSIQTSIKRNANLKDDTINTILNVFLELDAYWFLTGKGEMLRGFEMPVDEAKDLSKYVGELKETIEDLKEGLQKAKKSESQLEELLFFHKEKIQILEQKLQDCEQEKKLLQNSKSNV